MASLILLLQKPISYIVFSFVEGSQKALYYAKMYFDIRIWSAPACLINMVLFGWLLGMQNAKIPMLLLIITNEPCGRHSQKTHHPKSQRNNH
jgi:MATE family multidrug resistance protein